jgi:short-subunit dehydrogenase
MTHVALITGASSGIGEATARLLAVRSDARLVLVARRADRLQDLAAEIQPDATIIAADLTDPDQPRQIAERVEQEHGQLHLLVNNAGARWSKTFAEGGWANVEQTMRINFEAPVRLTEALLPLLRRTAQAVSPGAVRSDSTWQAPVSIVNVASTAARVSRPGAAAYSASKFALAGWTDGVYHELKPLGIHVGLVNPGFIATEGFPAAELRAKKLTSLIVGRPEQAAAAVLKAGPGGAAEVYVPGYYYLPALLRTVAPGFLRGRLERNAFATATRADGGSA